jgi:hypothetical protein
MKALAIALALLVSSASHAATYEAPNTAGGKIVLTGRQTELCGDDMMLAYTTTPSGVSSAGCWTELDSRVMVVFGKVIRIYEQSIFVLKGAPTPAAEQEPPTRYNKL